jgi:hypothetical protein
VAKLSVKNPLTGNNMDTSIKGIVGLLAGGLLLFGVVATAQNAGKYITKKTNNKLDFEPDPITRAETKVVDSAMYMG